MGKRCGVQLLPSWPLGRTIIGQQQVQGIDYAYTLQGWLKGINSTAVGDGTYDMGEDGNTSSTNRFIARDAFGFSLNYFNGDYASVNVNPFAGIGTLANTGYDLFNGNIASMVVNLPKLGSAKVYGYKFDQLNRLTKMDVYEGLNNATNAFSATGLSGAYTERLSYDANGNIQTYLRKDDAGSDKNNYEYTYAAGTNRLSSIYNTVNSQTKTYSYDAIGNTTADGMQGVINTVWNVYGKVKSLTNGASKSVIYTYGADGQRIGKKVDNVKEWYIRDATGNVMAAYQKDALVNSGRLSTKEFYKYGSSLLAIKNKVVDMETVPNANEDQTIIRGEDDYFLTDHLGNTRAIVSDKKLQEEDPMNAGEVLYYEPDVKAAYYYSAYGAISKTYGSDPLIAFNGQRKSSEIGTDAQTALYWEYNGDVGRRWNVDPKPKSNDSRYSAFNCNPIGNVDPLGDTAVFKIYSKVGERSEVYKGKYYDGKLHNPKGEVVDLNSIDQDLNSASLKIMNSFNQIRSESSFGKFLIDAVTNHETETEFGITSGGTATGENYVLFNFKQENWIKTNKGKEKVSKNYNATIVHEFAHLYGNIYGNDESDKPWVSVKIDEEGTLKSISYDELIGMAAENIYRAQMNLPIRTHYSTDIDGNPIKETQIKWDLKTPKVMPIYLINDVTNMFYLNTNPIR